MNSTGGMAASTKKAYLAKRVKTGKSAQLERSARPPIRCPECRSDHTWKDGFRYTKKVEIQRYLCRSCGYRFSKAAVELNIPRQILEMPNSEYSQPHKRILGGDFPCQKATNYLPLSRSEKTGSHLTSRVTESETLNILCCDSSNAKVCVSEREAKNLVEVESRLEKAAGATKHTNTAIDGNIINYAWHLKKQGYPETTIKTYATSIKRLHHLGADLMNPDSIKMLLANRTNWKNSYKRVYINAYTHWTTMVHMDWNPPHYKAEEKLPWIPTEPEIDQLIAGCGKKTATFLQLLKETAMRYIEAWRLKWLDVDFIRKTVNVKSAKHGKPRMLSISDKLILMLKNLSTSNSEKVFGDIGPASISVSFNHQRKRIAKKLQNPRINRITFHTLRHWKASIEYHRGMRLVELKEMLGHRSINSTMIYTHLIEGTESSDWISKVTRSVKGARALVETGFEHVKDFDDGLMLFRKRK